MISKFLNWLLFLPFSLIALITLFTNFAASLPAIVLSVALFPPLEKKLYPLKERSHVRITKGLVMIMMIFGYLCLIISTNKGLLNQPSSEHDYNIASRVLWNLDDDKSLNDQQKSLLKLAAPKILSGDKNCASIEYGDISRVEKNAYYIRCNAYEGEGFNVTFTEDDVINDRIFTKPASNPDAYNICIEAIKLSANNPMTVDIHTFGYDSYVQRDGTEIITQEFSAKNSFGVPSKFEATCVVYLSGDLQFSLKKISN